jgi:hypothetical protein
MEYQIIYTLRSSEAELQRWCNKMARDGWKLFMVNANTLYAIFERETDVPRDNEIMYVNTDQSFIP